MMRLRVCLSFAAALLLSFHARAAEPPSQDAALAGYFRAQTAELADRCLADIHSLEDWTSRREEYRRQLAEMLGLDPMPERTDLKPVITGRHETEWFTVENLHFQSRPGLYVTGNLYLPKGLDKPAPAVLYVCGHGMVKKDGISYGNKTHYQHHGGWFARNGYVCLTIDTVQLGEIEGLHHGTYREGMWWWNSRGYTPAGVEAFNGIRALDYLQSRPEVDGERLGVTGRSGGGAYSWWVAALDERVKAAVPVAGITDLQNHVVDGCVEGHCDCMFMVNTYRWDYPQVAALVAPRALLIANSDNDRIFPLDGVERLHAKVRKIYRLYGADERLGLQISPGPHKDTQELQVAAFRWFNRHLKGDAESTVENTGISYFTPDELRVFRDGLPSDQINTRIQETFVPLADEPKVPATKEEWQRLRDGWMAALKEKCFGGWPEEPGPLNVQKVASAESEERSFEAYEFDSQPGVRLSFSLIRPKKTGGTREVLLTISPLPSAALMHEDFVNHFSDGSLGFGPIVKLPIELDESETTIALFAPRGLVADDHRDDKARIQVRRRYMLLGQTLAGMQVWDIRRAAEAIRTVAGYENRPIRCAAEGEAAALAMYAAPFVRPAFSIECGGVSSHPHRGPDLLNVRRFVGLPALAAIVADRSSVTLFQPQSPPEAESRWSFPAGLKAPLGWDDRRFKLTPIETAEELGKR
ncbi:MAG TPA: prolyl oligopeptidase family serine peptidase [Pirellulales bacterium]